MVNGKGSLLPAVPCGALCERGRAGAEVSRGIHCERARLYSADDLNGIGAPVADFARDGAIRGNYGGVSHWYSGARGVNCARAPAEDFSHDGIASH